MAYRELVDQFEYTEDEKGITATRSFLWDPASNVSNDATLPLIGELFAIDISKFTTTIPLDLFCRNRVFKYVAADKTTWIVTCIYNNEPVDTTGYGVGPVMGIESLPQNVEYAGEFQLFEPPEDITLQQWIWNNDGTKVDVPIYFKVKTSTIRISRIIGSAAYETFKSIANGMVGKVNKGILQGMGANCVLFTGWSTERYNNYKDALAWRVELTFSYRDPDDTNLDGYQKILSKTGNWYQPIKATKPMYAEADFDLLFS